MDRDRESFFFIDVQARGYYPSYAKRFFKENNISLVTEPQDEEILAAHTADYLAMSYYSSRTTSTDPEITRKSTSGNVFGSVRNPYVKKNQNGAGQLIRLVSELR